MISPVDVYSVLRCKNSVLLESVKNGLRSYIAVGAETVFRSKGNKIKINNKEIVGDPFSELKKLVESKGQCFGYLGYDLVHFLEKLPCSTEDDLSLPDCYMIFPKTVIEFDHKKNEVKVEGENKEEIEGRIKEIKPKKLTVTKKDNSGFKSNFTKPEYIEAVNRAKEYVHGGDSFQIKISQRLEFPVSEDAFLIYRKLREINPSPYAAFLDLDGFSLVSCSPEHLLRVKDGECVTRPIGGTYPIGEKNAVERFKSDEKELAEHTMLIDLERNDLGKVCSYGSVKVSEMMTVEEYSHLIHLVTEIKGELGPGKDAFDAVKAMFPGGTITGCPKVRTMEIIDELEPTRRGPYTGSIGFFKSISEVDLNLIIRTLIVKDGKGYVQVGGGVVADSDPSREYDETIDKGMALIEAVNSDSHN